MMNQTNPQRRKQTNPKKTAGLILLAALVVAGVVLGIRVARLVDMTYVEMNTTPSPEPVAGNVMVVTIDPNAPTPEPVLRSGSTGDEVVELQTRLKELGYYTGEVDGQFGSGTRAAVVLFQQQHGLDADGIVGSGTRSALYDDSAQMLIVTPSPETLSLSPETPWVSADGMPLLVNSDHLLPEDYQPAELVNLADYCDGSIVTIKGSDIQGERVAVDALMEMLRQAHSEGITVWQVSAGYRTVSYQQTLFDNQVAEYMEKNGLSQEKAISATRLTVADPGASEHHTGLAFDITVPGVAFKGTEQADWLAENCWDFGFILRYTEDKESITGILAEPWHIRYVGVEHAAVMRDENLCLEEYVEQYGSL